MCHSRLLHMSQWAKHITAYFHPDRTAGGIESLWMAWSNAKDQCWPQRHTTQFSLLQWRQSLGSLQVLHLMNLLQASMHQIDTLSPSTPEQWLYSWWGVWELGNFHPCGTLTHISPTRTFSAALQSEAPLHQSSFLPSFSLSFPRCQNSIVTCGLPVSPCSFPLSLTGSSPINLSPIYLLGVCFPRDSNCHGPLCLGLGLIP